LLLFIAHLVGLIVSGVQVSVSFQIIPRIVGQLESEVRITVSFQSFAFMHCLFVQARTRLAVRYSYDMPPCDRK